LLLDWAPSPGTVPVFTGGPTWWALLSVPGFREVLFDGLNVWGQARGLQLQQFVWGADPRTALRRFLGLAESAHGALNLHIFYLYGGQTLGLQYCLRGHRPLYRSLF